ncbi:SAF domain-containing protein [Anaerolentibacter hominis]|uniref:SAF domain-containing protein n=1 Tax=Anaerolentibacter hominis TaxID=3079009 RepID=UPI0031B8103D
MLRHNKIIRAALTGAGLTALFFSVVIGIIYFNRKEKNSLEEPDPVRTLVRLSRDVQEGEEISDNDVELITVRSTEPSIASGNLREVVGKRAKVSLKRGGILNGDVLYDGEKIEDDLRLRQYRFIQLTDKLKPGDYVDVRISFSSGADFILLSKKKIQDITFQNTEAGTEDGLWIQVNEEEMLRMSSAAVDAYLHENCTIYAISYILETQAEAAVNYPVNEVVEKLLEDDPNIAVRAENYLADRKDRNSIGSRDDPAKGETNQNVPEEIPDPIRYFD